MKMSRNPQHVSRKPMHIPRAIIEEADYIIEARILCGNYSGNLAFIPRITLNPSTSEFPFIFKRIQFPARAAFGMTINKSQGQSVKYVDLNFQTPVFTHENIDTTTTNIVYPEALAPNTCENDKLWSLKISTLKYLSSFNR
ncbi:32392_t:CDS:2 [Gigaspora margarita]|uniref:32392_t:CDS:1 n=1 Tax=Gigaspora margarita TaxID=4874 RepID=A0ABN7UE03_GIGMA|nr:32392_t:CDS:2 [Gigaspora margarita]